MSHCNLSDSFGLVVANRPAPLNRKKPTFIDFRKYPAMDFRPGWPSFVKAHIRKTQDCNIQHEEFRELRAA
jgi:hypothetical protein